MAIQDNIDCIDEDSFARGRRNNTRVKILKGYGTIQVPVLQSAALTGATVGSMATLNEIEFRINIYKEYSTYKGEVQLVDYGARRQITSNDLLAFYTRRGMFAQSFFRVFDEDEEESYDILISCKASSCDGESPAKFYTYSAPLCNIGVNVGGELNSGDIQIYLSVSSGIRSN